LVGDLEGDFVGDFADDFTGDGFDSLGSFLALGGGLGGDDLVDSSFTTTSPSVPCFSIKSKWAHKCLAFARLVGLRTMVRSRFFAFWMCVL
jgi:hypothetical protein